MSKHVLKRLEVLAPAGELEKLKIAIMYGANAVYIGGNMYSLRNRAGNFTYEEIKEAVYFANLYQAKIYVAANMVMHVEDEVGAGFFFRKLYDFGVSAVIISDPGLIEICLNEAPDLPIHLSTQASAVNSETLEFWKNEGVKRVVLARELSIEEIREIRKKTDIEIEVFVHGAMCIAYSGRCILSNYMSLRDANRGGCSQSCRWKYNLCDMKDVSKEKFSMSSVDLSMIEHLPDLIEAGIDSLKIEGRMRSIHYVSTVVNVYKKAVDTYLADPQNYKVSQKWLEELWKVAQRELSTGFYYGLPSEYDQLFGVRRRTPQYKFVGEVIFYDGEKHLLTIRQRNVIKKGDELEIYGPNFVHVKSIVKEMWNEDGVLINRAANPMELITISLNVLNVKVNPGDMIRRKQRQGELTL
ncbi:MAG: U32 family peptidase [Streptococcaceae bacterium]|jgi:putative protease|nr:U32 family peptidase [Streptococcaceae bacterium]